jgi:site-specific DNA recombinase
LFRGLNYNQAEIPDDILKQLELSLLHDRGCAAAHGKSESERLRNRLGQVRSRIEQAYLDKLDGKITDAFWATKSSEWNQEEQQILMAVQGLEQQSPERIMGTGRTLELANRAYFLYLKQPPAEKAKLLRIVLSNCKVDATSVDPTYRKPFELIFQRVKNEEWLPELYDLRTLRFEVPRTTHQQEQSRR